MSKIARYLNQLTVGNVFDAPEILDAYAVDRSAVKIRPRIVALPESTDDVRKLLKFSYQLAVKGVKLPVTVRGSGLDETGADLGNGLIISTEKLNHLLESDRRERLVRVQAGITLKELNTALSVNGLMIPVGGHERETIGGLIANCPSDPYQQKYGGIMNYVERIEVVLANGEILQTTRAGKRGIENKAKSKTLEGDIYRKLPKLVKQNEPMLKNLRRRSTGQAGYPTLARAAERGSLDVMPLMFGSQGTLGVISEVILRAIPMRRQPKRVLATFEDFTAAQKFLDAAKSLHPKELNIYDLKILKTAEEAGKKLSDVTKKMSKGYVILARFDERAAAALRKLNRARKNLPKNAQIIVEAPKTEKTLNEFENSLISFLNHARSGERVPLVTDFYVPAKNLAGFVNDLSVLEGSLNLDLAIYGSYTAGNYSLRPKFDLSDPDFNKKATAFLKTAAFVIARQGGALAGGTPEGRVKAIVTNDNLTEAEKNLYLSIKSIFDRYEILNPNVKLGANAAYTIRHFRDSNSGQIVL